jgi:Zn-dependent protease with chaperone function
MRFQQGVTYSSDPVLATKKRGFVYAHELTHAKRYHVGQRMALCGLAALVNTGMWAYGVATGGLNMANLVSAVPRIITGHALFVAAATVLVRRQEIQADKEAMDTLGSSEGAIAFFEGLNNNHEDLTHPSVETRLAHARNWRKKAV